MSLTARAPHRSGSDYEKAFVEYLRRLEMIGLGVDESRRSFIEGEPFKSMDYLVLSRGGRYIVDIKGKRYPGGTSQRPRRIWENWVFQEDIRGLTRWEDSMGDGFSSLLIFVYRIGSDTVFSQPVEDLIEYCGKRYLFRAIKVADYAKRMRRRSPKWETVDLCRDDYRALVRPLGWFLREPWEIRLAAPRFGEIVA